MYESSIKNKNFVEFKAFENLKPQFTTVNEDFKFSNNAEISEIGLFRPDSCTILKEGFIEVSLSFIKDV